MANCACLGGFRCSRNALIVLNLLYIIVAFVLIGVAAWAKAIAYIVDVSVMGGIIACGVFLLIIASAGLIGTILHHQVTLFFYIVVLFLLFLVQFIVACACLAIGPSQQRELFGTAWKEAVGSRETMQTKFHCCGCFRENQNATVNGTYGHPPCKDLDCCINSTALCCTAKHNASQANETDVSCPCDPCWDTIKEYFDEAIKAAGGIGLFFSFTEVIGVWLAYRFRNQKDPKADPHQFL